MNTTDKPIVEYYELLTPVAVGGRPYVEAVNHPEHGRATVRTGIVLAVHGATEVGPYFETEHSRYVPVKGTKV